MCCEIYFKSQSITGNVNHQPWPRCRPNNISQQYFSVLNKAQNTKTQKIVSVTKDWFILAVKHNECCVYPVVVWLATCTISNLYRSVLCTSTQGFECKVRVFETPSSLQQSCQQNNTNMDQDVLVLLCCLVDATLIPSDVHKIYN